MIDRIGFVRKACNERLEMNFIPEEKWEKAKMTKELKDVHDCCSKWKKTFNLLKKVHFQAWIINSEGRFKMEWLLLGFPSHCLQRESSHCSFRTRERRKERSWWQWCQLRNWLIFNNIQKKKWWNEQKIQIWRKKKKENELKSDEMNESQVKHRGWSRNCESLVEDKGP